MQLLNANRLTLLPLTAAQLALYLDDRAGLEADLGLARSGASTPDPLRHAIGVTLDKMRADPDNWLWLTHWLIVLTETQEAVGSAGFKDTPDDGGEVEIGYGLEPPFTGHGYMTEALTALLGWAFAQQPALRITAQTRRDNIASHRVLQRLGFRRAGETELVYWWRLDSQASDFGSGLTVRHPISADAELALISTSTHTQPWARISSGRPSAPDERAAPPCTQGEMRNGASP